MQKFLPNIYQCHAKYLRIEKQKLTFEELKFLTEKKNVEGFYLTGVDILNEKKEKVLLEEIFELMPKIIDFE